MTSSAKLRELQATQRTLYKGHAYDGITAAIAAQAGFDVVSVSGYNVASSLGLPDVGLTTMIEVLNATRAVVRGANGTPVIADIDTGFGNAINLMRTVREFEEAGVAGVQFEDQVSPKRCPYLGSTPMIDIEEATGKIRAAVAARRGDLVLSARTDATTMDEVVTRGRAYVEAGADMVYVITKYLLRKPEDIQALRSELGVPIGFSLFGWETETLTLQQVRQAGGCLVGFPFVGITTVAKALQANYGELMRNFDIRALPEPMMAIKEFEGLVGFPAVDQAQREFLPKS
jgi:methylisocitrate lyase